MGRVRTSVFRVQYDNFDPNWQGNLYLLRVFETYPIYLPSSSPRLSPILNFTMSSSTPSIRLPLLLHPRHIFFPFPITALSSSSSSGINVIALQSAPSEEIKIPGEQINPANTSYVEIRRTVVNIFLQTQSHFPTEPTHNLFT